MLLELSDSVVVLSACVSPRLTSIARIFHVISFIGLSGLAIVVPFKHQLINLVEGGTERKYRAELGVNIAAKLLVISVSFTLALWFVSPLFMSESYSSCLAPF